MKRASLAALTTLTLALLASCSGGSEGGVFDAGPVTDFPPGSVVTFADGEEIERSTPTESTGDHLFGGEIVFHLVRLDDGDFLALYARDARSDCWVAWQPDLEFPHRASEQSARRLGWFRDPCHGAIYDITGLGVFGPAPRDLDRFPVELREGRVLVTLDLDALILGEPRVGSVGDATPEPVATPRTTERAAPLETPTTSVLPPVNLPAPDTFALTATPLTARFNHSATLLPNGHVLVAGGLGDGLNGPTDRAELYDAATGQFEATGTMTEPRVGHLATLLLDGRVLIVGGNGAETNERLKSAEVYDSETGRFAAVGSMSFAHSSSNALLLPDGRVLVTGGVGDASATAELFDPATATFTRTGDLNFGRFGHNLTLLNDGRVLVSAAGPLEIYDPDSGTFRLLDLDTPGIRPTATLLNDGRVLLVGGWDREQLVPARPNGHGQGPATATVVIFDPTNESLAEAGEMLGPRQDHTAVRLADGRVLIAGGAQDVHHDLPELSSAEFYDPVTNRFSATGAMSEPRFGHTLTLLDDGTVLVVGQISAGARLPAERYWPGPTSVGTAAEVEVTEVIRYVPNASLAAPTELSRCWESIAAPWRDDAWRCMKSFVNDDAGESKVPEQCPEGHAAA